MAPTFIGRIFLVALVLGFCSLSRLPAQENPPAKADAGPGADYRKSVEQETFSLINQYREAHQLPLLKWSDDIAVVARGHSKDMATGDVDFGHDGFGKRVKTLQGEMVGLKGAGENVLKTDNPDQVAEAAVNIWLHSPHHLANIRGDF